jgi:hypothetical protein
MGYNAGDRILETTTSTGTGNISLAGAVTGYRTFASIATADGDQFPYVIAGSSEWEVGIGTRVSSTSFSRSPTASSNAGALVSFSAGTKEVWIDWTNEHVKSLTAKNLFLNGGMEVSQEFGTTASTGVGTTGGKSICDISFYKSVNSTAVVTLQQVSDAPPGFKNSAKISCTTADASIGATDAILIYYPIEGYRMAKLGWGAAGAVSIAMGFWVKTHRTGIWTGALNNGIFNRCYTFEYTVNAADTWEYKTLVIPADTTGTWEATNGGWYFNFAIMLGSGGASAAGVWNASSFSGTANQVNGVGATTDTFQITGVSLIPGVVPVTADQSPHFIRPFDEELTLCQRHYEKSFQYATLPAQNQPNSGESLFLAGKAGAVTNYSNLFPFRVIKRATPFVTLYNPNAANAQVRDDVGGLDCSATTTLSIYHVGLAVQYTGNAGTAVGNVMAIHWTADARL